MGAPAERERLAAHLKRLDDASRRQRFCARVSPQAIDHYLAGLDPRAHAVIAAVGEDRTVRAVAEAHLPRHAGGLAELAVSVEAPFRGQGLGRSLMREAVAIARAHGAGGVLIFCLPDNRPMHAIARRLGMHAIEDDGFLRWFDSTPEQPGEGLAAAAA